MARQTIEILTDKSREIEFGKTRQWKLARNETMAWLGCDSYQNLNHPARTRAMAKGTFQNENVHF